MPLLVLLLVVPVVPVELLVEVLPTVVFVVVDDAPVAVDEALDAPPCPDVVVSQPAKEALATPRIPTSADRDAKGRMVRWMRRERSTFNGRRAIRTSRGRA